jgi:hypothetical protein
MKPGGKSGVPKHRESSSGLERLLKWRPGRRRIRREKKTVRAMIALYCEVHHGGRRGLCSQCCELVVYAETRLDRCPFGEQKPKCAKCEVHCYGPAQRERISEVMKYSGPRMLKRHPVLAVRHLTDSRSAPEGTPSRRERTRRDRKRERESAPPEPTGT